MTSPWAGDLVLVSDAVAHGPTAKLAGKVAFAPMVREILVTSLSDWYMRAITSPVLYDI